MISISYSWGNKFFLIYLDFHSLSDQIVTSEQWKQLALANYLASYKKKKKITNKIPVLSSVSIKIIIIKKCIFTWLLSFWLCKSIPSIHLSHCSLANIESSYCIKLNLQTIGFNFHSFQFICFQVLSASHAVPSENFIKLQFIFQLI